MFDQIINLVANNPVAAILAALLVVTLVVLLIVLWKNGKKEAVKQIIYFLVCQAEQQFGSKTGAIKLTAVWAALYEKLPLLLRLIFTKKQLEGYIEDGVKKLKKWAADNPQANLLSYAEERACNIDPTPVSQLTE